MKESQRSDAYTDARLRVRYAETDQMGMAYYANYLVWFEVGRAEYCRQHGFAYRDLERQHGVYLPVAEAHCRYITSARYDEEILVRTRLSQLRTRAMTFHYQILRATDETLLAEGHTVHIVLNAKGRPRTLPRELARALEA
jgi:acyl-CoA thioester hydrolase